LAVEHFWTALAGQERAIAIGAIAEGGKIFILDMGQSMRIVVIIQ